VEVTVGNGHIFVVSAGAEAARVRQLVEALGRHSITVIADENAGGPTHGGDFQFSAVGILVAWGIGPRHGDVPYAAERGDSEGSLISVKLAPGTFIPAPFDRFRPVDLSTWPGGDDDAEFERLIKYVRALVLYPMSKVWGAALDRWAVETPKDAVSEMQELMGRVSQLVEIFADDAEHTLQLRETLGEIAGSFRVVKEAIESFVAAGLRPGGVDGAAYAHLERGMLSSEIHNGRGHCIRIGARYFQVGGMREALVARARPAVVEEADRTFARLTNSDMDMFGVMDRLGDTLTTEARYIVRLLLTGQEPAAKQRIAEGREALLPLEDELNAALDAFQDVETSLGYANSVGMRREAVQVSIQTIHVGGDVINSNVVAATTIEGSAFAVAAAPVPDDIKAILTELHKAVGALTTALPDDEAQLAARDLEDLTREVTSGSRRPAFWRRAADGLVAAAHKVTDVGGPVVDLVAKVIALLG
jgi:hypothetical protein